MVPLYRFAQFDAFDSCMHGISRKLEESHCGFSQALHTGEPAEVIVKNRTRLETYFNHEGATQFVLAEQTHSDHVTCITEVLTRGWEKMEDAVADTDALVCNIPGVMIGVLTADCVPVLLFDPVEKVVAAVHAGWRGTQKRIVAKTVKRMQEEYGSLPSNIIAGIGPAIGGCCYEVGEEVASHFLTYGKSAVMPNAEKFMLDLPQINKFQLMEAGLQKEHISLSGICTACENTDYFSYRKENGCSGRFLSMIGVR